MSIVGDLREALQDVIAPDLKAMVRGLSDLREELRSSVTQLRDEIKASNTQLRDEIKASNTQLRDEIKASNTQLRDEIKASSTQLRDEIGAVERRTAERIERVYDAVRISDLTRRNAELEEQMKQLRAQSEQAQQH